MWRNTPGTKVEDQQALNEFQEFARTVKCLKALVTQLAGVLFIAIRWTTRSLCFLRRGEPLTCRSFLLLCGLGALCVSFGQKGIPRFPVFGVFAVQKSPMFLGRFLLLQQAIEFCRGVDRNRYRCLVVRGAGGCSHFRPVGR